MIAMLLRLSAYLLACSIAGAVGWVLAAPPSHVELVGPAAGVRVPAFEREGMQLGMAVRDLMELGYGAAPAQAQEETTPAPAAPDVAVLFRRDLTAIVRSRSRTVVWVVDHETGARRALRRGSVFLDAWRIASIGDQEVVLRRDDEERRVPIVGAPATVAATPG